MKQFSMKSYVVWLTLIPMLLMAISLEAYFLHDLSSIYEDQLMERGKLIAGQLASSSEYGIFANNKEFLRQIALGVLREADIRGVVIQNEANDILIEESTMVGEAEYIKRDVGKTATKYSDLATKIVNVVNREVPVYQDEKSLLIYQPVYMQQVKLEELVDESTAYQIGAVIIEMSKERTAHLKLLMFWVMTVSTLLLLLLSYLLRHLVNRRISSPIFELSDAVKKIGSGDLETRVPVYEHVAELNTLAVGINAMAMQLQHENAKLHERVDEATRLAAIAFETHEAIMITDADGNILRVNQAFQNITGYDSIEVLGKNPRILSSGRHSKDFYETMWQQLMKTGFWAGEIWDKRKSGNIYPKLMTINAIRNNQGKITQFVCVFRDITELKKAEEALLQKSGSDQRRAEELMQQLGNIFKNSFNEIYIIDALTMHFLLASEGAESNLGFSSGELRQFTPADIFKSIEKDRFDRMLEKLRSGEKASNYFEGKIQRKNGSSYPVEARLQFIDLDNPIFLLIVQDITRHKLAEGKLRNLSAHLQIVREEEKARIAREIHDHLGSTLTALKMDMNWLADEMTSKDQALEFMQHIGSMALLLDEAAGVARRVITELRPTILDDLGLCAALEWQARQFQNRTGIVCTIHCNIEEPKLNLAKNVSINLFRIFQEALTNVSKHSGATRVAAHLNVIDMNLILEISDNGRGISNEHAIGQDSFGMLGMRERTEHMGGIIEIANNQDGGLNVKVTLPVGITEQLEE